MITAFFVPNDPSNFAELAEVQQRRDWFATQDTNCPGPFRRFPQTPLIYGGTSGQWNNPEIMYLDMMCSFRGRSYNYRQWLLQLAVAYFAETPAATKEYDDPYFMAEVANVYVPPPQAQVTDEGRIATTKYPHLWLGIAALAAVVIWSRR